MTAVSEIAETGRKALRFRQKVRAERAARPMAMFSAAISISPNLVPIKGAITNFRVGEEVYPQVQKGDVVFIPKGTPYCMDWAECEYMVINGPAFQPGFDKPLDEDHQIPNIPY